ncbi:MAG TPA: multicopper oxidase family protein [Jatrophihabitans sp.]|nr:multicopper oxidase family protein [Jatrophihabitans sp.]
MSEQASAGSTRRFSRRQFLGFGAGGAVLVGAGIAGVRLLDQTARVSPRSAAVNSAEAARRTTGRIVRRELHSALADVDLGGRTVSTWAYDGTVPGPEIRLAAGDELRVRLTNHLPAATTVHWHGIALRNDMDGVPTVTQDAIAPGSSFDYAFVVPHPGTYFFHPHVGVQLDRGLQAALIVEDPAEPGGYDQEVVLVLDDWTDGWGDSPDALLAGLRRNGMGGMGGGSMGGMDMGSGSSMGGMPMGATAAAPLGQDTGDVAYPAHLINGRVPGAAVTVDSRPGRRIRFRLINAGSDTAYRFAIGAHQLTVTHSDGFPVKPVEVDTLILGQGERYDVVVTTADGAFPIVAVPEGKTDPAGFAVLRTASGAVPSPQTRPTELNGRMLRYADLSPTEQVTLGNRQPDRQLDVRLTTANGGRSWLINGRTFAEHEPLDVKAGERVRLVMSNQSMMFHPMHLHGHTFAVANGGGRGLRKDTINVLPMQTLAVDLQADNPGQWAFHCHNIYHGELGMMTVLSYVQ